MTNIFHLLSALVLLIIGFISVALSIYLIVRGITKVVNYIKSRKQNENTQ